MSSLDEFLLCLTFFCFARMEGWILFFWGETHTVGIHIFNGLMKTGPSGHSIAEEPLLDSRLAETLRGIDRVAPKDIDHVIGVIELHAEELQKGKDTGNFTLKKIKGRDWPILICDFAIRFKDGEKDILSWKPAADSVAAGKAYAEYVQAIPIKTSK